MFYFLFCLWPSNIRNIHLLWTFSAEDLKKTLRRTMFALFRGSHNRLLIHHMDALFCLKITTSKYHVLRFSLLLAFEYWNPICSFLFSAFTPAADTENAGKSPRGFFSSALKTFTYNLSQKSIVKSTVKCSMSGFSLIYFQSSDKLSVSSSADHVWEPGSKPSVE